ncbi:chemotaxis protein CheD [Lachnospiraceae bacterium WCA-9-b2]|jgi:chemotaxis protein CheD|uniref:Probable chemoreceptor glutamine deamidase CheD n=1 Tax=Sporofaciens musculi TaxID=2681861 RepID=A0A7X3MM08_9FIRM|nr:chemotaxis protein CheD [Sporofaciens musculi]MXP78876.1 chemotaxis protein CheD [Sporofaciens musculi]
MEKKISVGIADMKMTRQEGILITYALGSCIGVSFYDPMIKLGALLHIMLPEKSGAKDGNVFKFADTGIRETLRKLTAFGGSKSRMVCKIAGGAKMFEMKGNGGLGNIGERNAQNVKRILMAEGLRVTSEDVGANYARTMLLDVTTGNVYVRSAGKPEKML